LKGSPMELTIVGAGAIGGITGAHLARAGHRVQFVERDPDHVAAIRRSGLQVGGAAEFTVRVPVFLPEDLPGPVTTLLL